MTARLLTDHDRYDGWHGWVPWLDPDQGGIPWDIRAWTWNAAKAQPAPWAWLTATTTQPLKETG